MFFFNYWNKFQFFEIIHCSAIQLIIFLQRFALCCFFRNFVACFMKINYMTSNYWNKFQFCEIIHRSAIQFIIFLQRFAICCFLRNFVLFHSASHYAISFATSLLVFFKTNFSLPTSNTQHPASSIKHTTLYKSNLIPCAKGRFVV